VHVVDVFSSSNELCSLLYQGAMVSLYPMHMDKANDDDAADDDVGNSSFEAFNDRYA
jgi:hypothetical protein